MNPNILKSNKSGKIRDRKKNLSHRFAPSRMIEVILLVVQAFLGGVSAPFSNRRPTIFFIYDTRSVHWGIIYTPHNAVIRRCSF